MIRLSSQPTKAPPGRAGAVPPGDPPVPKIRIVPVYRHFPANRLDPLGDGEAIPPNAELAVYVAESVPRRLTLLQTAAFLTAAGYSVIAPAGGAPPVAPPAKITGLALNGTVTDGDVPLRWTADPTAASYKIEAQNAGATSGFVAVRTGVTGTSALVLGLPGPPDRDYRVRGTNAGGDGPPSDALRVAIPAATTPQQPQSGTRLIKTTGIPHRFKAPQAIPAGYPISFAIGFAPGDYPQTSRLRMVVAGTGGAVMPVQTDQHSAFPATTPNSAGTVWTCSISSVTHKAYAAGEVVEFRITREDAAEDRTPHTTLAAMRLGTDYFIEAKGLELGGDVMRFRFNDAAALTPASAANDYSFGNTPTAGIEEVRSGPIVTEWRVWGYTKRQSDGAQSKWQVGEIYLRVWASGYTEILPVIGQPAAHQAHPAGSIGPDVQTRMSCYVELFNGGTRVHAYSGPNASNAVTVPVSNLSGNRLTLPQPYRDYLGEGCAVGFVGALPDGWNTGTPYYPYDIADGRTSTDFNLGRTYQVGYAGFGSVPSSGTITMCPATHTYVATKQPLTTLQCERVLIGPSPRVRVMSALDEAYLTREARLLPPYRLTEPRPQPDTNAGLDAYFMGSINKHIAALDAAGDERDDDKIGYVGLSSSNLVTNPFDLPRIRKATVLALQWATYYIWADDHRSGRPPVITNGPNRDGNTYPGMGPVNPTFTMQMHDANPSGNPAWGGTSAWIAGNEGSYTNDKGHAGYRPRYRRPVDGSHLPNYATIPYLLTGDQFFADVVMQTAVAMVSGSPPRNVSANGKNYYGVVRDSGRTQGWALAAMGTSEAIVRDANPAKRMISDCISDQAEWWAAFAATDRMRNTGIYAKNDSEGNRLWMNAMWTFCVGMEVYRGTRPAWRDFYQAQEKFQVGALDDAGTVGGGSYVANAFAFIQHTAPDGSDWAGVTQFMTQFGTAPFPLTGIGELGLDDPKPGEVNKHPYYNNLPNGYPQMQEASMAMYAVNNRDGKVVSPNASRARASLRGRFNPPGGNFPTRFPFVTDGRNDLVYMTWDIEDLTTAT